MTILEYLTERAKQDPKRIAFPEATEEKMLRAIREVTDKGVCKPLLLGDPAEIKQEAEKFGISLNGTEIIDAFDEGFLDALIEDYVPGHPFNSVKTMKRLAKDPLYTALMMEDVGRTDFTVGGFSYTSTDFQMAALTVIGMEESVDAISSACLMDTGHTGFGEGGQIIMGDCVVCADPADRQLADIAIGACDAAKQLLGWEPRCALLSYSSVGSGSGVLVDKVVSAVRIANEKRPDLAIDGEFQLDTAIYENVAAKKVKRESPVAGKANILIFPNLDVGNTCVKLLQAFAGIDGYLFMMGLKKPVGDCSRSSPVSELVGNITLAGVRAQGARQQA